jgi:hypothetical protein
MRNFRLPIVAIIAMALAGCTFLQERPDVAKAGTQYGVIKLIKNSATEVRAERKQRIVRIATDVKETAPARPTTVAELKAAVVAEIAKHNLAAEDLVLINLVVDGVTKELLKRVGDGVLDANAKLQVDEVMDWIIEATALT